MMCVCVVHVCGIRAIYVIFLFMCSIYVRCVCVLMYTYTLICGYTPVCVFMGDIAVNVGQWGCR